MHPEDALEVLVEALHCQRAQFMEDATNLDTAVGMGIRPTARGDQDLILVLAELPKVRIVVVDIAQDLANLGREFPEEGGSLLVVGPIGGSKRGSQGDPDGGDMELPAIDPAVPAALGPVRLGINRGMRDLPCLPMLLVPGSATRLQDGAINGGCPTTRGEGLDAVDQVSAQAVDLGRQGGGNRVQSRFEGATRGRAAFLGQQGTELHLRGGLLQDGQERPDGGRVTDDHDHQHFEEEPIRVDLGATPTSGWWRRQGMRTMS